MAKPVYVPSAERLRTCRTCSEAKPETDYRLRADRKDLKPDCRPCDYILNRKGRRSKEESKQNYERYGKKSHFKTKYNITPDEYAGLLLLQGGVCAICPSDGGDRKLCVDHDHKTGEVRGLLCYSCNTAIGLLKEDPVLLEAAIAYLTQERGF